MRFKSEESEWVCIRDSKIWDLPHSNENTIMPALKLSYTHLPPHLRQCFAYCSLFPQDFKMRKEEVIKLWMANELTQPREGMKMEDIGNGILNSLVWRSFFQVKEKDSEGNTVTFVMHDLVHDLSCFVAKNECCNIDWNHQIENIPNGTRHLSVKFEMPPSSSIYQSIHQSAPKLRTLIFNSQYEGVNISAFKCLRALCMAHFGNGRIQVVIPESIGNLKHLRYLDLSGNNFKYLPKAICGLRNLQTLKLEGCYRLQVLPKCLSDLSSLRHLNIKECYRLSKMPKDMQKMTCLQTLSMFIVGANKGRDIKELERMDNLTGELEIACLENVRSRKDAECANLMRKKRIETLVLTWYNHTEEENECDVIEGLQPDSNLRNVVISGYQGICFPRWLEYSTLPNLVAICLEGCTRCELPPSLSRLPFLKTLNMVRMPCVKFLFHIEEDTYNDDMVNRFSSLEDLGIDDMPELEDWCSFICKGGGEGQMFFPPRLKMLGISKCPKLRTVPWSPSLETLRVAWCSEMVLGSLRNLPRLCSLNISYFDEVTYFPEGSLQYLNALESFRIDGFKQLKILPRELGDLSKLTSLTVRHCDELVFLPEEMRNLSSLQYLTIEQCKNLESLPEMGRNSLIRVCTLHCQRMTNLSGVLNGCEAVLQSLSTHDCPNLEWDSIKFAHLLALRSLSLSFSLDMTSLPDRMQDLSSMLQALSLNGDSLVSLPEWIGNLTGLQSLCISQCRKLTMLPEGLHHLTNLKRLVILDCHPDLQKRCQSSKGEDWHKISHIPCLLVEGTSR